MRVLNTEQMREADRRTIEDIGIPSIVLMENAGRQAVAAMEAAFDDLGTSRVGVVCGRGNNGGDGFVIARTLVQRGIETAVFLLGSVAEVRGDARTNLEVLGRIGMTVVEITNAQEWELHFTELSDCDLIVDAILGTGFRGRWPASSKRLSPTSTASASRSSRSICRPASLPTRAAVEGPAIEASMTVTLGAPKIPLIFPPADTHAGDLVIADIGIPVPLFDELEGPASRAADARADARDRAGARRRFAQGRFRPRTDHRRIDAAGPARHISRRSARCDRAPASSPSPRRGRAVAVVAAMAPEYMTEPLDETPSGTVDFAAIERVLDIKTDVIAVGPGLGQSEGTAAFVQALLERAEVPLVLDADALNAFAGEPERLMGRDGRRRHHHAAPGRDGAPAQHLDRSRAARSAAARARVRRRASRPRHPQGPSHGHRRARWPDVRQPDRQRRAWRPAAPATC